MTVSSATSTPAAASTATTSATDATSQLSSNFSTFLTLLTTQLKNQDPTSPMDSNTFTQQLVEYSQVEQQIDTNTNLKSLITQGSTQLGAYATSYLGKAVSVTNGNAALTNGAASWTYSLGTTASSNTLVVTDANGECSSPAPSSSLTGFFTLGLLSLAPLGRPGFLCSRSGDMGAVGSRSKVARYQVRPTQMSRTVLTLTP